MGREVSKGQRKGEKREEYDMKVGVQFPNPPAFFSFPLSLMIDMTRARRSSIRVDYTGCRTRGTSFAWGMWA